MIFSIQNQTHIQVDSDSQEQDQLTFVVQDAACFLQSAQRKRVSKEIIHIRFWQTRGGVCGDHNSMLKNLFVVKQK